MNTTAISALDTVQQCYEHFGAGNIPAIIELMDDKIIWKDPGNVGTLYKETRKGKSEILDFFKELSKQINITKFDVDKMTEVNGTVFVTGTLKGTGLPTGLPIDTDWAMEWRVVNGKVTYHHLYTNTYALGKALGI